MTTFPNGVQLLKWPHRTAPSEDAMRQEMTTHGYQVYDLQTIEPWFFRARHAHDEPEIRAAVAGVTTFHFDDLPVTIEAGDILLIPAGVAHEVRSHNGSPFSAFKGSVSGVRSVTEHGDGTGSVERLARNPV